MIVINLTTFLEAASELETRVAVQVTIALSMYLHQRL